MKGFGDNQGMEYPFDLTDYANEVKQKLKEHNVEKPCVIAHSFGGRIAIKLASENPLFFDKIVLSGSAGLKPKFCLKRSIKKVAFRLLKSVLPKERLKKFYSNDYNSLSPIMQQSFIKIVNEHLDDRLRYIKNPTLILVGDKDKETPYYMAKRLNRGIPFSSLKVIKGAGHFAFIDKPMKFNMEVGDFLFPE